MSENIWTDNTETLLVSNMHQTVTIQVDSLQLN